MSNYLVDLTDSNEYTFYYNAFKGVNEYVNKVLGDEITKSLPGVDKGVDLGKMGSLNIENGDLQIIDSYLMAGICASVNKNLAEEILERAKYYCPVETGELRQSGRIEELEDGRCRIIFDAPYAWYVHELTYRRHEPPTCAKFLDIAIQEVCAKYNISY